MMTKLSKDNFNIILLNVILGLQKGSRLLFPYSKDFQKLGYSLFAINKEFNNSEKHRISPDIIINSNQVGNTLLIETTYADVKYKIGNENEIGQIERYQLSEVEFLATTGQIPNKSLNTFDIPFIVSSKKSSTYFDYFNEQKIAFPLLEFSDDNTNDYKLKILSNSFSNTSTSDFFKNEMIFDRVPCYIDLDIEELDKTKELLFEKVAKNLIRILQKEPRGSTFKAIDIARNTFHINIFEYFGDDKKKNITVQINKYLHQLLSSKNLKELKTKYFNKFNGSNNTYEVLLNEQNREIEIRRIIKKIHDITQTEILNKMSFQLSLFDDFEEN